MKVTLLQQILPVHPDEGVAGVQSPAKNGRPSKASVLASTKIFNK